MMITQNGALFDIIKSGVRILESACGPCIGMGFAPPSGGTSIRSFNRNFEGRSGTKDAKLYLASVETCIACAIYGKITDPRKLGEYVKPRPPEKYLIDDSMIIPPLAYEDRKKVEVIRGPNIKPFPIKKPLEKRISGKVLLKTGDNITTDHILPAGAKILPLRSNIPAISDFTFERVDKDFVRRAKEYKGGFVVGGANYGQGSSREHAAIAPMYLEVKAVIASSFARIHRANLVNFGIIPLVFEDPSDYNLIDQDDELLIDDLFTGLDKGTVMVKNLTKGKTFGTKHDLTTREIKAIKAGGVLNLVRRG
jgi:aconitate hydratase